MITGVITLGMTAAPVIGSYINLFFGWRANFALLLILGIISLLLSVIYLPKPSSDDKVRISLREYLPIIKSERVNIYNFTLTFISQAYWLFVAIAPILYMNDLAVSLDIFGLYQGSVAVVFSIGSFSTGYLVKKYGMIKCLKFSSRLLLSSVILTIIATIFNVQTPIFITFIMLIISIANIIPVNVLWPIAIDIIPEAKGRVTAYVTSSRLIFTAISVQIAGYFHNGTFIPLGIMMSIFLFIGYIFLSKILIQEKNIISKYSEK
jgi:DHA1 family bicyclomycin/chloramphenicol resistance-like MFS transporter